MKKVNVSYLIYDEVIKGKYKKQSLAYQLDNEHIVDIIDGFIAIEQISGSSEEGVIVDYTEQTNEPIFISIENTTELDINHPAVANFLKYLVIHEMSY
jgi:S-methylmethionine-dependent homocysteine/selenocysteine methylase